MKCVGIETEQEGDYCVKFRRHGLTGSDRATVSKMRGSTDASEISAAYASYD